MGVSKNSGTPKSSILIGFSIINHPFWGTPIFGNTHIIMILLTFLRQEEAVEEMSQDSWSLRADSWRDENRALSQPHPKGCIGIGIVSKA